jgi:peroxiredoxin Q/BCP
MRSSISLVVFVLVVALTTAVVASAERQMRSAQKPADPPRELKVGDMAPDFHLPGSGWTTVSLKQFRGRSVVLYFYPKDFTTGCTTEACQIRDNESAILGKKAVVLGVSPDSVESHLKFIKAYSLPFALLSDKGGKVAQTYGAWGEKSYGGKKFVGNLRTTFLIDGQGRIAKIWRNVNPDGHALEILAALGLPPR